MQRCVNSCTCLWEESVDPMRKWCWSSGRESAGTAGLQQRPFAPRLIDEADKLCCSSNLSNRIKSDDIAYPFSFYCDSSHGQTCNLWTTSACSYTHRLHLLQSTRSCDKFECCAKPLVSLHSKLQRITGMCSRYGEFSRQ